MPATAPYSRTDAERLHDLEAAAVVRQLAHEYMACCDVPGPADCADRLCQLFTADAVWEGIGERYVSKFGRLQGREQVLAMLLAYLPPHSHFHTNGHFLSGERIQVDGERAEGEWLMQQISRYDTGRSELLVARIRMRMSFQGRRWAIAYFSTERLGAWQLLEMQP
jgi:hypothetical protein